MQPSNLLANCSSDEPILFFGETALTTRDVVARLAVLRDSHDLPLAEACVVPAEPNDLEAILIMLAAQGWASEIVLDSGEADNSESPSPSLLPKKDGGEEQIGICDTQWLLATSGTTGAPKWVRHDLASLTRTVLRDREKGAAVRWGLLYDPRRFAGLQVVLQALLGGSSLVVPTDRTDFGRTVSEFGTRGVNALSTTPSAWRKLLMAGIAEKLDLRFVTLGGEIADAGVLAALRSAFPQARITHIYASTEAGVGFAVKDGLPGFPAELLEQSQQGVGLQGVGLRVDGNGQLLVRPPESALQTRYPIPESRNLKPETSHSLPRSSTNKASLVNETSLVADDTWVPTGDLVEKRGPRYFFLGRANRVINVAGDKVHPQELEDVALAVAGVALALARAISNPIVGQVPELLVQPTPEADRASLGEIVLQHCRSELPRVKWPARVLVVEELELSGAGKKKGRD